MYIYGLLLLGAGITLLVWLIHVREKRPKFLDPELAHSLVIVSSLIMCMFGLAFTIKGGL